MKSKDYFLEELIKKVDDYVYEANLKDKSAQLSVDAKFLEKYSQKYSDSADYIWRTLPLAGSDKDNYEEPTISYFVVDPYDVDDTRSDMYCYGFDGTWYRGTKLATVDKKGKVTFNGKGEVRIFAVDTAQTGDGVHAYVDLIINASPDSVKGKNIKMSVGQGIYLSHYLEYKEGKNKVENYQYDYADLSIDKESDENFYIVRWGGDYWIRALNPGAKLTLKVTDSVVKANKGSDTTVTITTTAFMCIILSFISPIMALLQTIPSCVMGGVCITLYGFIAVSGLKMIQKVNLEDNANLFTVSVILIAGIGGMSMAIGKVTLTSIACALLLGIFVNIILNKFKKPAKEKK